MSVQYIPGHIWYFRSALCGGWIDVQPPTTGYEGWAINDGVMGYWNKEWTQFTPAYDQWTIGVGRATDGFAV